jgi:hypothetical protein
VLTCIAQCASNLSLLVCAHTLWFVWGSARCAARRDRDRPADSAVSCCAMLWCAGPPQQLPRFFASQEEEQQQLQVACKRILVSSSSSWQQRSAAAPTCAGACACHVGCRF